MMMITRNEAIQLIQESSRYEHMIVVATLMYYLAQLLDEDVHLWEMVGLVHDLDYDHVKHDMSLHGLVASETLKDKLVIFKHKPKLWVTSMLIALFVGGILYEVFNFF